MSGSSCAGCLIILIAACLAILTPTHAFLERFRPDVVANLRKRCQGNQFFLSNTPAMASADTDVMPSKELLTLEDIEEFSEQQAIYLSATTLGPLFRVVARDEEETILAYADGFTVPALSYMHLDTLQVVRTRRKETTTVTKDMVISLPGLLTCYVMGLAYQQGCTKVECLAINDEDRIHRKLVRAYKRIGFEVLREVNDNLSSFFDLIVWGGVGTLMECNSEEFLQKWYPKIKQGEKDENFEEDEGFGNII